VLPVLRSETASSEYIEEAIPRPGERGVSGQLDYDHEETSGYTAYEQEWLWD